MSDWLNVTDIQAEGTDTVLVYFEGSNEPVVLEEKEITRIVNEYFKTDRHFKDISDIWKVLHRYSSVSFKDNQVRLDYDQSPEKVIFDKIKELEAEYPNKSLKTSMAYAYPRGVISGLKEALEIIEAPKDDEPIIPELLKGDGWLEGIQAGSRFSLCKCIQPGSFAIGCDHFVVSVQFWHGDNQPPKCEFMGYDYSRHLVFVLQLPAIKTMRQLKSFYDAMSASQVKLNSVG
jgi:hypothetical protein